MPDVDSGLRQFAQLRADKHMEAHEGRSDGDPGMTQLMLGKEAVGGTSDVFHHKTFPPITTATWTAQND